MTTPRLNRRLTLEAPQKLADGAGGYTQVWVPLGELWAEVKARSGRERNEAGVPVSAVSLVIRVRAAPFGSPLRPMAQQRFREGERLYLIQAVAECDPSAMYLTCYADEEVVT